MKNKLREYIRPWAYFAAGVAMVIGCGQDAKSVAEAVVSAATVAYNNLTSGLFATTVQGAIDEVAAAGKESATEIETLKTGAATAATSLAGATDRMGAIEAGAVEHDNRIGQLEVGAEDHEGRLATVETASAAKVLAVVTQDGTPLGPVLDANYDVLTYYSTQIEGAFPVFRQLGIIGSIRTFSIFYLGQNCQGSPFGEHNVIPEMTDVVFSNGGEHFRGGVAAYAAANYASIRNAAGTCTNTSGTVDYTLTLQKIDLVEENGEAYPFSAPLSVEWVDPSTLPQ